MVVDLVRSMQASSPPEPFFSSAYDLVSLVLTAIGIAVTLGGFGFAIFQVMKAKSAAEAASESADQTARSILRLMQSWDMASISGEIAQIRTLVGSKDWKSALLVVVRVKHALIRAREDPDAGKLLSRQTWLSLILDLSSIEEALSEIGASKNVHKDTASIERSLSSIHDRIAELNATVQVAALEGPNAG